MITKPLTPYVASEVDALKQVIVHRPDEGIEMVTPDKAQEYLYDDIVFLKKMKAEHDIFVKILVAFIGEQNVLDIQTLLAEILNDQHVRDDLVDAICQFENTQQVAIVLKKLSSSDLANSCITGILHGQKNLLFPPVSNLIFCRDIGVVIKDWILVCEAAKAARSRESLISRYIFKHSPMFKHNKIIEVSSLNNFFESQNEKVKQCSIEGGDAMLIDPDHLLVGLSERTTAQAIKQVAATLLKNKVVKTVTQVSLPKQRYCMHLDTIMTFISDNECVAYSPLVSAAGMQVTQWVGPEMGTKTFATLEEMLRTIRPDLKIIPCGGGASPYQEREQWTDGCNLFAIRSGVVLTYDRNTHTSKALQENGYTLISAKKLLKHFSSGTTSPAELHKCVIMIPSDELSRARGGTHCLTFPVVREQGPAK